ncbi:hypothetical protein K435DRAFT_807960 [Dendrothele bispora CBS 962.96]|uniref:YD repeat-containing protein n=1 Tax=Dendrothele bispora (strain CBS 962.96) TaxID=1314807 RepID=A0A4S8L4A1_DENBC|nr:hypothetical protein K435DRAFT_807960 [Dendrothele bispora CBS 962.96]
MNHYRVVSVSLITLLAILLAVVPGSGQETAITIAKFGMGEPPVLTDTTHLIPLGTEEGGVRTTYQYDDVGEFVTTRPDGKATTISGENSGIMIASASGFVISITNPPSFLPTDLPPFLGGNEVISCGYTAADGGECEDRVFGKEDTTTFDYTNTFSGTVQQEVLPVSFESLQTTPTSTSTGSISQSTGPNNDDNGGMSTIKGKNGGVVIMISFVLVIMVF